MKFRATVGCAAVVDETGNLPVLSPMATSAVCSKKQITSALTAQDIYSAHPKCIHPDTLATTAFEIMKAHDITQLIVSAEDNIYLGVLHLHDLLQEGIL